jgi:hypothetical protein
MPRKPRIFTNPGALRALLQDRLRLFSKLDVSSENGTGAFCAVKTEYSAISTGSFHVSIPITSESPFENLSD